MSRQAVRRLPRLALWLLAAAYVVPGILGRDPWRGADFAAFGQMLSIAEGRSAWTLPALGGVPTGAALLPNWLGAAAIALGSPWLDPALAARLPFAALLALTLAAVWYASFHLARSDAAQPLPFAFGGEADPVGYARAVADGALLALIASLGLLQLGHETTPELAQLAALASLQWAVAAAPHRRWGARFGMVLSLPALAVSGAPVMALVWGAGALALCLRATDATTRSLYPWLLGGCALAALAAWPAQAWAWRLGTGIEAWPLLRMWLWFLWPGWVLALWTMWRWRGHWPQHHLALPLLTLGLALVSSIAMGGSDRALLLGLPGVAVLAAFALPTLRRGASAAVDWFSVFFFSASLLIVWVFYAAMQLGVPATSAATLARLAPGFVTRQSWTELFVAALGTLAWLWLVRWRTGRHREALWKSLVLPAGGVAVCWLLLMTLWLPLLDYARSNRPLVQRLSAHLAPGECVAAPLAPSALVAALEFHGRRLVDASAGAFASACPVLLIVQRNATSTEMTQRAQAAGWAEVARERRPTDRQELTLVMRRAGAAPPPAVQVPAIRPTPNS